MRFTRRAHSSLCFSLCIQYSWRLGVNRHISLGVEVAWLWGFRAFWGGGGLTAEWRQKAMTSRKDAEPEEQRQLPGAETRPPR